MDLFALFDSTNEWKGMQEKAGKFIVKELLKQIMRIPVRTFGGCYTSPLKCQNEIGTLVRS
jgi:hypothetical protein